MTRMKLFDTGAKVRLLALLSMFLLGGAVGRAVAVVPWWAFVLVASVPSVLSGLYFIRWCDELERQQKR